jgi:hypothetical protein
VLQQDQHQPQHTQLCDEERKHDSHAHVLSVVQHACADDGAGPCRELSWRLPLQLACRFGPVGSRLPQQQHASSRVEPAQPAPSEHSHERVPAADCAAHGSGHSDNSGDEQQQCDGHEQCDERCVHDVLAFLEMDSTVHHDHRRYCAASAAQPASVFAPASVGGARFKQPGSLARLPQQQQQHDQAWPLSQPPPARLLSLAQGCLECAEPPCAPCAEWERFESKRGTQRAASPPQQPIAHVSAQSHPLFAPSATAAVPTATDCAQDDSAVCLVARLLGAVKLLSPAARAWFAQEAGFCDALLVPDG